MGNRKFKLKKKGGKAMIAVKATKKEGCEPNKIKCQKAKTEDVLRAVKKSHEKHSKMMKLLAE